MAQPIATHEDSIEIAAPPEVVYDLVTSMERYGEWSTENTGGYWRKGADGVPGTGQVGDQFVGINRDGDKEWKAPVEIIEREHARSFAFVTGGREMDVALWRYELRPSAAGTVLVEQYELRNPMGDLATGGQSAIDVRMGTNRTSIRATLEGIKAAAEQG